MDQFLLLKKYAEALDELLPSKNLTKTKKILPTIQMRPVPPPQQLRCFAPILQCFARIAEIPLSSDSNDEDLNNNDDNSHDQDQGAPPLPSPPPQQLRRSARIADMYQFEEKENIPPVRLPQQLRRSKRITTNAVVPTPPPQLVPVSLRRNELHGMAK
jgi:hypothetical protein